VYVIRKELEIPFLGLTHTIGCGLQTLATQKGYREQNSLDSAWLSKIFDILGSVAAATTLHTRTFNHAENEYWDYIYD